MGIFLWAADLCPPSADTMLVEWECSRDNWRSFTWPLGIWGALSGVQLLPLAASPAAPCGVGGLFSALCPGGQREPCFLRPSASLGSALRAGQAASRKQDVKQLFHGPR